jgi:uncharacterized membrane protein
MHGAVAMIELLILLGIAMWIFGVVRLAATRAWWVLPSMPAIGGLVLLATLPEGHGEAGVVDALAAGAMALLAMVLFVVTAIALLACWRASSRARATAAGHQAAAPLPTATVIDVRSSSDDQR